MMKKTLKLVAVLTAILAVCALVLTSCGGPKTTFVPSGKSQGTLRLGFDAEYPPYGYLDTEADEYKGFDLEFAKLVCEDLGYTLELVPIDWNAKDAALASKEIDMIWSGFTIDGRENDYEWTVPYVDNSIVVLTADSENIKTLADLAGKTVTVQAGSSGEAALKDNADLVASLAGGNYLTCANYTNAFQELKTGAVQAIVIDIAVAKDLIQGQTGYSILDEAIASEQYGVGFLKGNTEQCKMVSDAMVKIAKAGKIDAIAAEYGIADSVIIGK